MTLAWGAEAQLYHFSEKVKTIPGTYVSFAVDNMENIYLLSITNQLKKLNGKADSVAVYNNIKKFGEATSMDVSNPLNILLYYKNFGTIVTLDGMLNIKNTIDLRKKNIFAARAVGLSYDGKIWLYDEMENCLKKIDEKGDLLLKTSDLRQVLEKVPVPDKIYDQNKYVYLCDPNQGIYVFDYYGTLKNKIPLTKWQNLQITDNYILWSDAARLYRYELATFKQDQWPLPVGFAQYSQVFVGQQYLYALGSKGLDIFKLQP